MNYNFISIIDEQVIIKKADYFIGHIELLEEIKHLSSLIFDEGKRLPMEITSLLSINGNILFFGIPGTGKTSLAYSFAKHVLETYGIQSYELSVSKLIKSELGKTTSNMKEAIDEVDQVAKEVGAVLILDEIDRLFINRESENEVSELKRALLEFMDYLDRLTSDDRLIIIGITNLVTTLDDALLRRFGFQYEIKNSREIIIEFFCLLNANIGINIPRDLIEQYSTIATEKEVTCDIIKKMYQKAVIKYYPEVEKIQDSIIKRLEGEIHDGNDTVYRKDKHY